ncbi:hypothetical protein MKW98_008484, partial [Papaver atlanticum]
PSEAIYGLCNEVGIYFCSDPSISQRVSDVEDVVPLIVFYRGFCWRQKSLRCRSCGLVNHTVGRKLVQLSWIDPMQPLLGFVRATENEAGLSFIFESEIELAS